MERKEKMDEILRKDGLSLKLLDMLSLKSSLTTSLKKDLKYFNKEELLNDIFYICEQYDSIAFIQEIATDCRVKSFQSTKLKYERYYPDHQARKVFDDLLGFRVLCNDYDEVLKFDKIEHIRIADGQKLSFTQQDIEINGHAIECRINAENPEKGFRPSPGTITDLHLPGGKGIRVDSAIYSGCSISPYYDSMVAKLIVWAKNRDEAIQKMQSALGEVIIEGIDTNVDYLYELLNNPVYQSGEFNVNFIDTIKH